MSEGEYDEVAVSETAVAVVETPDRDVARREEQLRHAEREDRARALSFAMTGEGFRHNGRAVNDKRKPEEIVQAAEKYYAFLTAGRAKAAQ